MNSYEISPFPGGSVRATTTASGLNFARTASSTLSYSAGAFSVGMRWQYWPSLLPAPGSAANAVGGDGLRQSVRISSVDEASAGDHDELRSASTIFFNTDHPETFGAAFSSPGAALSVNKCAGHHASYHDTFSRRFFVGAKRPFW